MTEFKFFEECKSIKLAKPFVTKTCELFENEFSMKILDSEIISITKSTEVNNINFVSSLSGAINANIIFSFEPAVAKKLLDSFPYIEYTDEIEEEMMFETVAEFLNIVIGNAMKDIQSKVSLSFSPPVGLSGDSKLFCNKNYNVCKIILTLEEGSMLIIFSTTNKDI